MTNLIVKKNGEYHDGHLRKRERARCEPGRAVDGLAQANILAMFTRLLTLSDKPLPPI